MVRWFLLAILGGFGVACFAVDRLGAATVYFNVVKPVLDVPPAELLGYSLLGILIDVTLLAGAIELFRRWRRNREMRRMATAGAD